jgi:hypothetical protein
MRVIAIAVLVGQEYVFVLVVEGQNVLLESDFLGVSLVANGTNEMRNAVALVFGVAVQIRFVFVTLSTLCAAMQI